MPEREFIQTPILDDNVDIGIGLTLPFNSETGKFGDSNYLSIDQALSNLRNLILTRKGERPMHPNFGTNLQDYLFEPNNKELREKVGTEIEDAIKNWLPYIVIKKLVVDIPAANQGGLTDRHHGIYATIKIGLINNSIDEEEIVLEIRDK